MDAEAAGPGALFSFEGRINRGTFWKITLLQFVAVIAVGVIVAVVTPKLGSEVGGMGSLAVMGVVWVAMIWISLATQAKRWHDIDKSGWMVLLNIIPVVGFFAFLYSGFQPGTMGANRFGEAPVRISM